jgi:DinB family protein
VRAGAASPRGRREPTDRIAEGRGVGRGGGADRGAGEENEDVSDYDAALTRCGTLDEDALARPWSFRGRQMDVRYALYRTLEDGQEVLVRVAAGDHSESRRILALAQRAFGGVRALLIGLPGALLDRAPRAGEWSIQETVAHMTAVEQRYALQTKYAVDRTDADPMRIADSRLPSLTPASAGVEIGTLLARLAEARAETDRWLSDVPPAKVTRPTIWAGYEIDVRFRLHRFAAHIEEHTVQCEKTLQALGWRPTEGRQIARRLAAVVGEVEGLGAVKDARELEARLAERLASVAP